ncbi:MAG: hypothetical protein ISR77_25760 [Pirellulaceae bacterium]|nr:hypothetical protein [Pirellulaceae bacterium]
MAAEATKLGREKNRANCRDHRAASIQPFARRSSACMMVLAVVSLCPLAVAALPNDSSQVWDASAGVVIKTPVVTVQWADPVLRFVSGGEISLKNTKVAQTDATRINLTYDFDGGLQVSRELSLVDRDGETELVETFRITPEKTITSDLEIERPFMILEVASGAAVLPLFNGWAKRFPLDEKPLRAEWQLGNVMRDVPSQQIGLPVVQFGLPGQWLGAVCADPYSDRCTNSPCARADFGVRCATATQRRRCRWRPARQRFGSSGFGWPRRRRRSRSGARWIRFSG